MCHLWPGGVGPPCKFKCKCLLFLASSQDKVAERDLIDREKYLSFVHRLSDRKVNEKNYKKTTWANVVFHVCTYLISIFYVKDRFLWLLQVLQLFMRTNKGLGLKTVLISLQNSQVQIIIENPTCSLHSCYYKSLKVGMGTKNYLAAVSSAVAGVLSHDMIINTYK